MTFTKKGELAITLRHADPWLEELPGEAFLKWVETHPDRSAIISFTTEATQDELHKLFDLAMRRAFLE